MKNYIFRQLVSLLLLVCMLSSYFLVGQTEVNYAANANDLQVNYINLMKGGKAGVTGNTDAIMTLDDLRNVVMFLSCSYVPFYTSLDGDSKEICIEKGVSMLKQIGFDENVAKTLVNNVYEASLNSAVPLYVNKQDIGGVYSPNFSFFPKEKVVRGFGRVGTDALNSGIFWKMDDSSVIVDKPYHYNTIDGDTDVERAICEISAIYVDTKDSNNYDSYKGWSKKYTATLDPKKWDNIAKDISAHAAVIEGKDGHIFYKFRSGVDSISTNTYSLHNVGVTNDDGSTFQRIDFVADGVGFPNTGKNSNGSVGFVKQGSGEGIDSTLYKGAVGDAGIDGYTPITLSINEMKKLSKNYCLENLNVP